MSRRLGTALGMGIVVATAGALPEPVHARGLDILGLFGPRKIDREEYNDDRRGGFFRPFRRQRRTEPLPEIVEKPYVPPVYRPDPLEPLISADFKDDRPDEAVPAAVWDTLADGGDPVIRVHPSHRKPILDFYQARGFKPLWIVDNALSRRAERLLALLARAGEDALLASDYLPEALGAYDPAERQISTTAADLAKLDVELTVAAVKYAHHASAGRVVPGRMSKYIDMQPTPVAFDEVLTQLGRTVRPDEYLSGLHPTHPFYADMKRALAKYRIEARSQGETQIPEGSMLRLGHVDDRVPVLRRKLESLGLLEPAEAVVSVEPASNREPVQRERDGAEEESVFVETVSAETGVDDAPTEEISFEKVYDEEVVAAVKEFQKRNGLSTDGVVGPATTRALNGDSFTGRIEKLALNMERARWLPRKLGKRHVFVNQTAYEMRLVENGSTIHRARVIIGKYKHQTPSFSDEMETVVFNPYWNVPRSIATKEMLPNLWANPYYLDDKGFEVFSRRGQVSSGAVDWEEYTPKTMPYTFRQPPGPGNALGSMKFLFPNRHNVYLHDTPTKHLFKKNVRTFSHGCVRVQNPDKLAEVILRREGWTSERISAAVRAGKNRKIALKTKVSVHLTYFTAWADGTDVSFYKDMYGRDRLLKRALGRNLVAMK